MVCWGLQGIYAYCHSRETHGTGQGPWVPWRCAVIDSMLAASRTTVLFVNRAETLAAAESASKLAFLQVASGSRFPGCHLVY